RDAMRRLNTPDTPKVRQMQQQSAKRFLCLHWTKISFLAKRLASWGRLDSQDLIRLTNGNNPLACYGHLYRSVPRVARKEADYLKGDGPAADGRIKLSMRRVEKKETTVPTTGTTTTAKYQLRRVSPACGLFGGPRRVSSRTDRSEFHTRA